MTKKDYMLFMSARKKVAEYLAEYFAHDEDGCCKSYEGTWELLVSYPNYFEDETATAKPDYYQVTLHCYVLGPGRHYEWSGKTWAEVFRKCNADIDKWIKE